MSCQKVKASYRNVHTSIIHRILLPSKTDHCAGDCSEATDGQSDVNQGSPPFVGEEVESRACFFEGLAPNTRSASTSRQPLNHSEVCRVVVCYSELV